MKNRCLYCYLDLEVHEVDFHATCSKKIFGAHIPPILPYDENNMEALAEQVIQSQTTITGVQPKLSLHLTTSIEANQPKRFTIVGLWGGYILKPPSKHYLHMPEVEDLTMHLAQLARIKIVPHSLIRLQTGNLAYITKRIDRIKKSKLHMEDMCQLTERLSEHKYHGSYEQIAKAIQKFSVTPGLDVVNFLEIVLFSFLTGNADMHLKNFSLITSLDAGPILAPAYDLLATALVNPTDDEDLALTLNGRKKKIKKSDFETAFNTLGLDTKQQKNIFNKMYKALPKWEEMIDRSFLDAEWKEKYKVLIKERFLRIS
jgi:serine/threonine-protein kinase HipA